MVVYHVTTGSWAAMMQIQPGDLMRGVGGQARLELLTNRDIRNVFMEIRPLTLKFLRVREPRKTNYALLLERRQQL